MVGIPYLFFLLFRWYSFRWWSQRRHQERAQSQRESGFAKSWYGWAGKRKGTRYEKRWKDVSDILWYALHWRSRTENYEWWFWDPDGSKAKAHAQRRNRSVLRYLPEWMKPYRPASSQDDLDISHIHTRDIERGQSNLISCYNFGTQVSMDGQMDFSDSSAGQDETENQPSSRRIPSAVMSGALADMKTASTVRRRYHSDGGLPIWQPGNEEMHRATWEQLFEDEHNHQQGPPMVNDALTFQSYTKCPPAKLKSDPPTADRRTQSMPMIADAIKPQTKGSKYHFRNIHSAEQLLRAKEYHVRSSGDLKSPLNSEITSAMVLSISAHDTRDLSLPSLASNLDTSRLQCNKDTPTGLGSKLKWWISPHANLSGRYFRSDDHNVAGLSRDFSFVTSQQRYFSNHRFDDLSAYEAEGSIDQAISECGSSTSTRADMIRLSQYRKRWYHPPSLISSAKLHGEIYPKKLPGTGVHDTFSSFTRTARTLAAPHSFRTPRKRRRPIDRGIFVSMVMEPTDDEGTHRSDLSRPAAFQRDSALRSVLFPPPHGAFDSWRSDFKYKNSVYSRLNEEEEATLLQTRTRYSAEHGLSHRECQTLPSRQSASGEADPAMDESFAQCLHGKLERLQYELSPGFRGPPSAFAASWGRWAPVFNPNLQTRVRSLGDTKLLKENVNRSATSPLRTTQDQSTTLKLSSPLKERRGNSNTNITTATTSSSGKSTIPSVENPPPPQQDELNFDPAAWILRRPPRGSESEFGPPNVLYAGNFGIRRTLAEWNQRTIYRTRIRRTLAEWSSSVGPKARSRKRCSSEAELEEPPAKIVRQISGLVKVRLKRGEGGWVPLGFVQREGEGRV